MAIDHSSLDAVVSALYASLSFGPGEEPDIPGLRSLFGEGARLVHAEVGDLEEMSLDRFVDRLMERVGDPLVAFQERELARRVDRFGCIAQVFSSFEAEFRLKARLDVGSARGVNAIQLRRSADRWLITSILWSNEGEGQSIPAEYLP